MRAAQTAGRQLASSEKKPDAGRATAFRDDVGADIQLEEIRKAGKGREKPGSDSTHEKRDDADEGISAVGIDFQPFRQPRLEDIHVALPMEKEKPAPRLVHDLSPARGLAGGEQRLRAFFVPPWWFNGHGGSGFGR